MQAPIKEALYKASLWDFCLHLVNHSRKTYGAVCDFFNIEGINKF